MDILGSLNSLQSTLNRARASLQTKNAQDVQYCLDAALNELRQLIHERTHGQKKGWTEVPPQTK